MACSGGSGRIYRLPLVGWTARVSANRLSAVYYGTGMEACRMVDSSMNFIMNALGPWGVDSGFMYLLVTFYLLYVYGVRVRVPV